MAAPDAVVWGLKDLGRLDSGQYRSPQQEAAELTNGVAIDVEVLRATQRSDGGLFKQLGV